MFITSMAGRATLYSDEMFLLYFLLLCSFSFYIFNKEGLFGHNNALKINKTNLTVKNKRRKKN